MRVAIYVRLSEEDRNKVNQNDDSNSIQNQKSMLIEYSVNHGWDIYNVYSDDDYTGSDRNRPAFCEMIKKAEQREFDIILCKTQSRFTRELELVEKYINGLFPIWGIRFISIVDNADTENKGNKKSRQINGLVNEWYLEDMSDNIRSVLTNRRKNGFHIGAFAPYGYAKDPERKGHLIVDEEAALIVRRIFNLYNQGLGKTNIARILNEEGIPNPTEYKHQKGFRWNIPDRPFTKKWQYYTIAAILENEMYIGNMVQGKYGSESYKTKKSRTKPKDQWIIVNNTHEPIVDKDTWDTTQRLRKEKSHPFGNGEKGIFTRKLFCMYCGCSMRTSKNHGLHYYRCVGKYYQPTYCEGAYISDTKLKAAILEELKKIIDSYLLSGTVEKKIKTNSKSSLLSDLEKSLNNYNKKLIENKTVLKNLYIDKVKGVIDEENYLMFSKDFTDENKHLSSLIESVTFQIDSYRSKQNTITVSDIVERYSNPTDVTREMVDVLIEKIVIGKRMKAEKCPIEIYWNF